MCHYTSINDKLPVCIKHAVDDYSLDINFKYSLNVFINIYTVCSMCKGYAFVCVYLPVTLHLFVKKTHTAR